MTISRAGDVFHTAPHTDLGERIRWGQQSKGEEPSIVSHSGLVVRGGRLDETEIVEALARVRRRSFSRYLDAGTPFELWRPTNLTDEERRLIVSEANRRVGRLYPWHRLLFHLADEKLFRGRNVMRRLAILDRWRICTPLVGECYAVAGKLFGAMRPEELNPDRLRDFQVENPDKWELIAREGIEQ